tara:strand:- start:397 stop:759 length:363 start_codon:yes stop_codon:yes gene_type:complete
MRTKENQMPVGSAEYFDNLNKEIKEKQSELSLSNSKVVAMKQMIADRDQEIETLKEDLKRSEDMHQFCLKREMTLSRKAMEMGYNPMVGASLFVDGFVTLEDEPLTDRMIEIYNDPIWND